MPSEFDYLSCPLVGAHQMQVFTPFMVCSLFASDHTDEGLDLFCERWEKEAHLKMRHFFSDLNRLQLPEWTTRGRILHADDPQISHLEYLDTHSNPRLRHSCREEGTPIVMLSFGRSLEGEGACWMYFKPWALPAQWLGYIRYRMQNNFQMVYC